MGKSDHPLFEIVTTTAGAISIRNKTVNEIMHNPVGPWQEANSLYIHQSDLKNRLLEQTSEEFVLFDVGLGAAANALAAIVCAESTGDLGRPLRLVSFERDLELLKFALENSDQFDHFRGYEKALESILAKQEWSRGKIFWELREGNFLKNIETEIYRPHLIFFDPYSPKVNEDMWTTSNFKKIHGCSRQPQDGGTSLYTYSQATRIRTALISAGFYVGYGASTGLKAETTEAATGFGQLKSPLGKIWFDRWQKSDARYPYDCKPEDRPDIDAVIAKYMAGNYNF